MRNDAEHIRGTSNLAAAAIILISCLASFTCTSPEEQKSIPSSVSPASSKDGPPSKEPPASATVAPQPPLKIQSSGRLPTEVKGFRLGTGYTEVLSSNPNLEQWWGGGKPPSTPGYENALKTDTSDGFSATLIFQRGRLISIIVSVDSISPADEEEFESNTLSQLGKPDVQPWEEPGHSRFVWIDGDIRVGYTSYPLVGGDSREVKLEICVYPAYISGMSSSKEQDGFLESVKSEWGEVVTKHPGGPLPRELAGLRLGMAPWEVRAAVPGINIRSLMEDQAEGDKDLADGGSLRVYFFRGSLMKVSETRNVSAKEVGILEQRIMAEYGTPDRKMSGYSNEGLTWDDGQVYLSYGLNRDTGSKETAKVSVLLIDDAVRRILEKEDAMRKPTHYKEVPIKSFF